MNPKTKYKNSLLTSPNLSASSSYLGSPKYQAGGGAGGGGGGSWGPTKQAKPINTAGMIGAPSTGTPTSPGSSKLTLGSSDPYGLAKPSQAWQDTMKNVSVGADGKVGVSRPPVTPSDTSATGTNATKITSPAGQAYINGLGTSSGTTATTPTTGGNEDWKNTPEYKTYLKYIRDRENPSEQSNLQTAMKNLADIQSERERMDAENRWRYEDNLDKSGGLKSGTIAGANAERSRTGRELSDIALRESAAARTAGVYQATDEANKKDGFSLGKDQTRYEYNPETGSYEAVGVGGGSGTEAMTGGYTAGSNPTIDSYIKAIQDGTAKISDIPDEYKDMVMQGLSSTQKPQSEISKQAISVIGELLSNPKLDRIFGPADQFVGGVFGEAALAKNKYEQLKGLLSLDNIKYLKGTGAISDAEQRLLANAASALGRNLGNTEARQVLTQLQADLSALGTQPQQQGGEIIQTSAGPVNTNW